MICEDTNLNLQHNYPPPFLSIQKSLNQLYISIVMNQILLQDYSVPANVRPGAERIGLYLSGLKERRLESWPTIPPSDLSGLNKGISIRISEHSMKITIFIPDISIRFFVY